MRSPTTALRAAWLALSLAGVAAAQQRPDPVLETTTWNGQTVVADRLLVAFEPGTPDAVRFGAHLSAGHEVGARLGADVDRVDLPPGADLDAALATYADLPGVRAAQPDVLVPALGVPDDPKWSQQWALPKVGAPAGWELAAGDPACVVAIIDSGVKTDHVDLDAHYAWGHDFYADDPDPSDAHGHGTHCAGIAAAETDNGVGVAGAAFGCHYAAYRAGNGSFPTSSLVASIDDAVAQGAHVISMSWGSPYNNVLIRYALEDAADAGCVLVAAAGNDGSSTPFYPAALPEVIAVASSSPSDARSSFSNFGPWVSVAAPGQGIYSTAHSGGYTYMSGTSMACPLVAGLAALLYARLDGTRSVAHAAAVRAALEGSAVPVGGWVEHGRVDLPAALAALDDGAPAQLHAASATQLQAFGGETLTLTGAHLLGVTDAHVGDEPATAVSVLDATRVQLVTPPQPALGATTLHVTEDALASAPLPVQVVATHPPRLTADAQVHVGDVLELRMGGGPLDRWLLLGSLTPHTLPFRGTQLLYPFVVLTSGELDTAGLRTLHVHVTPSVAGVTLSVQIATLDGGLFVGTSEVRTLTVAP